MPEDLLLSKQLVRGRAAAPAARMHMRSAAGAVLLTPRAGAARRGCPNPLRKSGAVGVVASGVARGSVVGAAGADELAVAAHPVLQLVHDRIKGRRLKDVWASGGLEAPEARRGSDVALMLLMLLVYLLRAQGLLRGRHGPGLLQAQVRALRRRRPARNQRLPTED